MVPRYLGRPLDKAQTQSANTKREHKAQKGTDFMKMFEVTRLNTYKKTYRILAENAEDAIELSFECPHPDDSLIVEAENTCREVPDCTCGICHTQYPWACQHAEPEDGVIDIGMSTLFDFFNN
jgi:hypothetical protein